MSFLMSVCPSVRMEQLGPHWTEFREILYLGIFRIPVKKLLFHQNLTRITGTSHEDLCTFMIISRWILLRMRNVSDKSCRENQNTRFMLKKFFEKLFLLWDNVKKYGTARQAKDDNIIRRMRFACWITKATDTHSECVTLFYGYSGYANASQRYVVCTMPVLFINNIWWPIPKHPRHPPPPPTANTPILSPRF
jgi:hypothetical protein